MRRTRGPATAATRPTRPGWWGGAHPFALLDTTVVHNGEISSYDANRRFIEMFGYSCDLLTDTEVITYIIDYLGRKLGLTYSEIANVIAVCSGPPLKSRSRQKERERLTYSAQRLSHLSWSPARSPSSSATPAA